MKFFFLLLAALSVRAEVLPLRNASFDSPLEEGWKSAGTVTVTNGAAALNGAKSTFIWQELLPAAQPLTVYSVSASVGLREDALLTNGASLFLSLQSWEGDKLLRTLAVKEILVGREQLSAEKLNKFTASFTSGLTAPRGALRVVLAVGEAKKGDWLIDDVRVEMKPAPAEMAAKLQLAAEPSAAAAQATGKKIQYNRDIRPILSENCFSCHGPDSASRKADLRLDRFADATKSAIIPGAPDKSDLMERLVTKDEDDIMPPLKTKKTLTAKQIELIRQWIAEGAQYELHWSFIPPAKAALPEVHNEKWVKNPIDRFVLARLEREKLIPANEADARTLARRAALDLTGLPPTPEMVQVFLKDKSEKAYENYVDWLLESKAYGEHRARYWMDAARYADTHGIHFDNYREMWTYRQWVINAFNENKRFDQFTLEQLAGDLLPNPSLEQLTASGLNRCNITSNEGGLIDEEYYVLYMKDRTETASTIFMGLTAQCAGCHDHKFDPFSQREYYSLAAFFNNSTVSSRDGNRKDPPPVVVIPTAKDRERWFALETETPASKKRVDERREAARPDFEKWLPEAKADPFKAAIPTQNLVFSAALSEREALPTNASWTAGFVTSEAFYSQSDVSLKMGDVGNFERDQAWSYGAWVRVDDKDISGGVMARMDEKNDYRGWDLFWDKDRPVAHFVNKWPDNAIRVASKTKVERNKWTHIFVTYDGSSKPSGVRIFINGKPAETESDNKSLTTTIRTTAPLTIGHRQGGGSMNNVAIQDARVYDRQLRSDEVAAIGRNARAAWLVNNEERTKEETEELFPAWLNALDPAFVKEAGTLARLEQEDRDIRRRGSIAHVMHEKSEEAAAYILHRGEYDRRRDRVMAATPEVLPPMSESLPRNRLGLAKWLLQPNHPLTARVTVNRFWQEVFGTALVRTAGDFGISGELPSNPELLDWMAVEFVESGWDVKRFFKLMVTSAAYRQSALTTPDKLKKDPQNILISRGPRFRMDAEMIRDYALAASGLLVEKIGGPSVKPYQPEGVWETVAMRESDTKSYEQDHGENLYRRSLYTFWKRAAPPASMDIFNAPSRETCTVRRDRTDTPLQALVTLNDTQFVEAARKLAERALQNGGSSDKSRLNYIAESLLARPLRSEEMRVTQSILDDLTDMYKKTPAEADALLNVGESKSDPSLNKTELAAYTMAVNQLMNLDEVLNK